MILHVWDIYVYECNGITCMWVDNAKWDNIEYSSANSVDIDSVLLLIVISKSDFAIDFVHRSNNQSVWKQYIQDIHR